jgi:3-isopropylmalate/(R)-2-methylmalate dehydratase small subunit
VGKVWKFGDNVNTDVIIPGRCNISTEPDELAKYAFCDVRPDFAENVQPGDIIVAGDNFGCGSSREHAPIAIKASSIQCVIAKSFSRLFFRNSISIGLTVIDYDLYDEIEDQDILSVNFAEGIIYNQTYHKTYSFPPLPDFIMAIIEEGGIVNFIKNNRIKEYL